MALPLRIDPAQQFSCAQCGRCCRRWEIVVSQAEAEADALRNRDAVRWFRESDDSAEGAGGDPFVAIDGAPGFLRIRKRRDGACGFLSIENRCRIHEELGGGRKPLTCRVFPFSFHPTPSSVIVKTSFGWPAVAANQGQRVAGGASQNGIEALRDEWFSSHRPPASAPVLVAGRPIGARSIHLLRTNLPQLVRRRRDLCLWTPRRSRASGWSRGWRWCRRVRRRPGTETCRR